VIGDGPFAVLFGDDLVDGKVPALKQLIDVYEKTHSPVIALEKINKKDSRKYGIVDVGDPAKSGAGRQLGTGNRTHRIKGLVEKPDPKNAPSDLAIIGKYIITPEVMDALTRAQKGKDGEVRLIEAFRMLVGKIPLYGYEIEGKRYDTGDRLGFLKATVDYALKRPDLGPELRKYLRKII
jgi:UTP--glucose-1-phosphate uridylyltransferase